MSSSNEVMSVIFLLSTLQLPEYVVDLTIKSDEKDSDEKLNLEVRVSLSPVLIQLKTQQLSPINSMDPVYKVVFQ